MGPYEKSLETFLMILVFVSPFIFFDFISLVSRDVLAKSQNFKIIITTSDYLAAFVSQNATVFYVYRLPHPVISIFVLPLNSFPAFGGCLINCFLSMTT